MKGDRYNSEEEIAMDQAIAWLARLDSDTATDADRAAFVRWLSESELHQNAFDDAELLSNELNESADQIRASLSGGAGVVVPFTPIKPFKPRPLRWLGPVILAAACVTFAVVFGPEAWRGVEGQTYRYQTRAGETRALRLADGSRINLDAASILTVRLAWHERHVALLEGEASFDVAKDVHRPFLIDVGDQRVRVVGTEFNIWHYDHVVDITVRRGIVEVTQPNLTSRVIARLTKGEELRHIEGARESSLAAIDPDVGFAWTQGRLICNDKPLPEIVAYLNRRYKNQIILSAAARQRRFTGALALDDQASVVDHLAGFLSLSVVRNGDRIELR